MHTLVEFLNRRAYRGEATYQVRERDTFKGYWVTLWSQILVKDSKQLHR